MDRDKMEDGTRIVVSSCINITRRLIFHYFVNNSVNPCKSNGAGWTFFLFRLLEYQYIIFLELGFNCNQQLSCFLRASFIYTLKIIINFCEEYVKL